MKVSFFPYPLQIGALESFCHPDPCHVYAKPAYHDGQALAGNGFILIRVSRGLWMPSDFEAPPAGFMTRFQAAPWKALDPESPEWRSLDEIKGDLFRFGQKGAWLNEKCAPSPVWRVGGSFLARQTHLQMIARLPRCEILLGQGPLHFRFSGGIGILANDPKLKLSSFSVFAPQYCPLNGHEIKRSKTPPPNFGKPPPPEPTLDDWPPVDASDDSNIQPQD
jgi:hypothetical protein